MNNNTAIGFNLGINKDKKIKDKINNDTKLSIGIIEKELIQIIDQTLYFKGFIFKKYKSTYIKNEYKSKNNILFRCKNYRKNQTYRKGLGVFCNAQILMKVNDNKENEFSLLENHSDLCIDNIQNKVKNKNDDNIDNWEEFKKISLIF
jgi:hypothetical protein